MVLGSMFPQYSKFINTVQQKTEWMDFRGNEIRIERKISELGDTQDYFCPIISPSMQLITDKIILH